MTDQERREAVLARLSKEGYKVGRAALVHTGELNDHDCIAIPTETVIKMLNHIDGYFQVARELVDMAHEILDKRN
jgi:hypothetical protein